MEPTTSGEEAASASAVNKWALEMGQKYQHALDKTVAHVGRRWAAAGVVALAYLVRVCLVQGYYLVTYALGIYMLSLLIGFLSPQNDPDDPTLPTLASDEFRPFVRRLPEFKFWYAVMRAFVIAFVMTFFSAFDVPVFWPILLFYFMMLFTLTMKKQIMHMVKYKYVPFTFGKQRYGQMKAQPVELSSD